jgi:hypothetical protein
MDSSPAPRQDEQLQESELLSLHPVIQSESGGLWCTPSDSGGLQLQPSGKSGPAKLVEWTPEESTRLQSSLPSGLVRSGGNGENPLESSEFSMDTRLSVINETKKGTPSRVERKTS